MAEPVHLSSPLTFNSKGVAETLVQDSPAEIQNCVYDIVLCTIGEREDNPEFGIADQTFTNVPLDLEAMREQIATFEPRAELSLAEAEELIPSRRRVSINT